jgi:hypothetical protein
VEMCQDGDDLTDLGHFYAILEDLCPMIEKSGRILQIGGRILQVVGTNLRVRDTILQLWGRNREVGDKWMRIGGRISWDVGRISRVMGRDEQVSGRIPLDLGSVGGISLTLASPLNGGSVQFQKLLTASNR